jgi:hypothetical protein
LRPPQPRQRGCETKRCEEGFPTGERIHATRFVGVSVIYDHKARLFSDQAVASARYAAKLCRREGCQAADGFAEQIVDKPVLSKLIRKSAVEALALARSGHLGFHFAPACQLSFHARRVVGDIRTTDEPVALKAFRAVEECQLSPAADMPAALAWAALCHQRT